MHEINDKYRLLHVTTTRVTIRRAVELVDRQTYNIIIITIIIIMIVVVLGAFACLIRWRKYLLVRRQYEQCMNECMNDVFVQHKHRVRS